MLRNGACLYRKNLVLFEDSSAHYCLGVFFFFKNISAALHKKKLNHKKRKSKSILYVM